MLRLQVVNSRLAMLGFVAAITAEAATHKGVLQQVSIAPIAIAATFLLFTGDSPCRLRTALSLCSHAQPCPPNATKLHLPLL